MKRFLSVVLTGFMLMGCSAAHNAKVKDKITEEYGHGDHRKKVVVKTKSENDKLNKSIVEKASANKPSHPLLKKEETESLIATSNVSVSKNTVEDYIGMYSNAAMSSMKKYGIPASIKLAQGILESGSGNGTLCRTANNHFGIKCKEEWTGETVSHTDDAPDECFRKYRSALESYNDHSEFLANRVYYKNLFNLDQSDYTAWAKGLKKAGYATDPRYPQKLISIIERYKLYEYDQQVLGSTGYFVPKVKEELTATNFGAQAQTYIVQAGDTLYAISQKFNSTVDNLKQLNNLNNTNLNIGQTIKIQ
ncbi:MAG TPA: glucosaminidase domain-containing protein [Flavobacterium sp.]|nr:glucosaminidase domain-containing protein [Flavobacterium sp.]